MAANPSRRDRLKRFPPLIPIPRETFIYQEAFGEPNAPIEQNHESIQECVLVVVLLFAK
jgi:hypothetical protein